MTIFQWISSTPLRERISNIQNLMYQQISCSEKLTDTSTAFVMKLVSYLSLSVVRLVPLGNSRSNGAPPQENAESSTFVTFCADVFATTA